MAGPFLEEQLLVDTVDAVSEYGLRGAAEALGITVRSVRRRLHNARARGVQATGRHVPPQGPVALLSEHEDKLLDCTPDEAIADVRSLAEEYPDKVISRNFYRVNGTYAESAWNQHFGTFEEFKRQAKIKLSRQQHAAERHIAKHASVDHYRAMNDERSGWEDKYLKPTGGQFQTAVLFSDVHDKQCCPFYRRVLLDTIKRVQPEKIVGVGDIFDLYELSRFEKDPREFDLMGSITWVHDLLADIREASGDSELSFVEGNHEARLLKHLADETPHLRVLLSDLHGMTVSSLLGLDRFEVNYIARADLGAWNKRDLERKEMAKNYLVLWDCLLLHHFPHGKNLGLPGLNGHHHKHICTPFYNHTYGSYEWHQMGSGHKRSAVYCDGQQWSNGFMLAHVDTINGFVQFEYVDTTADHAVVGGRWYMRDQNEKLVA